MLGDLEASLLSKKKEREVEWKSEGEERSRREDRKRECMISGRQVRSIDLPYAAVEAVQVEGAPGGKKSCRLGDEEGASQVASSPMQRFRTLHWDFDRPGRSCCTVRLDIAFGTGT